MVNRIGDITGRKFNNLTALKFVQMDGRKGSIWRFRCDCGNIVERPATAVMNEITKSCGCLKHTSKIKNDLTGRRFGKLLVLERSEDIIKPDGKPIIQYKCVCDCGNETIVRYSSLVGNRTVSCGCYHKEQLGRMRRTHGLSHKERLYSLWLNMKDRCYNPNNNHYASYGGRGIKICDEWLNDYMSFRTWCLENGYEEEIRPSGRNNLTIDRIDVNGNYEPNNCRFISNKENCLNKRDTLTDEERYKICPICGKHFTVKKRNQQQTCSARCGQIVRKIHYKMERNEDGTFKASKA